MAELLTGELYWLFLTVVFTSLVWVIYILDRFFHNGLFGTLMNPPAGGFKHSGWAQRAMLAHRNAIENLVVFGLLVIIAKLVNVSNEVTIMAAQAFFVARVAHFFILMLGIPVLRTVAFLVGFAAEIAIALAILGMI